jgi:hypothetical protein
LITSVTGAAALGAALGLLASACVADGDRGAAARGAALRDVHGRQAAALTAARPAERTVDHTVAAPGARMAAADARMAAVGERIDVTVYYLRPVGPVRYLAPERHEVRFVPSVGGVATSAVAELLAGTPHYLGAERPFPAGTRLLGLGLDAGTATVNLSRQALGADAGDGYAVQALVWTVTQLPQVKRVVLEVEGRSAGELDGRSLSTLLGVGTGGLPLVRDRGARLAPILLAEPFPRAVVGGSRVVAKGQARVASGPVGLRMHDPSGQVVAQGYAALPSSAPGWVEFSGALTFLPPPRPQVWTVEAFEVSPTDASVIYSVAVPVWVGG